MPTQHEILEKLKEHFPAAVPRPQQLSAMEEMAPWIERLFIQEFDNPLFFGGDLPTGVGKSNIALTLALAVRELYEQEYKLFADEEDESASSSVNQVWVVTQNKILQDQYLRDFAGEVFDLRGLDNYKCYEEPGATCGTSKCGRIRGKSKDEVYPKVCTFSCEYDKAKWKSQKAPILSLNVAKALTLLKNPRQKRPILMIFDEGHEIESSLDNESSVSVTTDELQKIGFVFERYFQDLTDLDEVKKGITELIDELIPARDAEERAEESRDVKRYKKLESLITKLGEVKANMEEGIDYVSCATDKLDLKPLQIFKVFAKTFDFPVVFLSATLLSKKGFQSMTGLNDKNFDWFSCESPFPISNRPIKFFWRLGASPLNYGNMMTEMPNLVNRVQEVMDLHPNERGIIHSHTYKIAERIYQDLYPKYGDRLIFPKTAKEQKDALDKHARVKNSVLLSPSMTQGVDLREDLCRFIAMCKVPWLPTNDPVVKARMETDPTWYNYKTAMTVVQAPGRGVRSETDRATTYLLDPGYARFFNMTSSLLPNWFLQSLQKKPCGRN